MRNLAIVLALLLSLTTPVAAQILTTEVWVGALDFREGRFDVSDLKNISNDPGYDNQPAFFPDGQTLVYTSVIAGDLGDSGLGLHAFLVDLRSGARTPLPEARGFSPTPTADGKQLMMLREGRVWLHDLGGKVLGPLTETTTAGYYARFDDRTYVLFMNEQQRRIVIYDAKTKKVDTMAVGASTAPYRIPGQRAVTFVAEEPFSAAENTAADAPKPTLVLRRLDLPTRKVTTLATIPFPTGGQHVWTARGTLLIASGPQIYEWNPARPDEWKPIYRATNPDLQGITRIAISPASDRIAIVSTPRDEVVIRESRAASNEALAARNAAGVSRFFAPGATLTASSGQHFDGREAIEKALAGQFEKLRDVVYVRTPETIDVSRSDAAASERGTWTGRWTSDAGPVEVRGDYMAVWRRETSAAGTPSWTIQSELFVSLECTGSGCASR